MLQRTVIRCSHVSWVGAENRDPELLSDWSELARWKTLQIQTERGADKASERTRR